MQQGPGRLIIHMGVQKTGSTALHHFLTRNQAALQRRLTVLTPTKRSLTRELGRSSATFTLNPCAETEATFASAIEAMRDHVMTLDGTCLISHENLLGAMPGRGGVVTLYPHITRVLDLLDENFAPFNPEYVIYTRALEPWKRSVYNQAVKSDGYTQTLTTFLDETARGGDWDSLKTRITDHLGEGRVTTFRVEDEPEINRPGAQLLAYAGLQPDEIAALDPLPERRNESLNAGSLEFLRLVNTLGLDRPVRSRLVDLISDNQSVFVSG